MVCIRHLLLTKVIDMEHERQKLIRKIEYPLIDGQPVVLLESRLYQSLDTLAIHLYLKMKNVSGKTVTDVYVDLCCFDQEVNLVSTRPELPYEGLSIPNGTEFGDDIPVSLPSLRTASITATLHRVCFSDGTVWQRHDVPSHLETAKSPDPPEGDLLFSERKAQRKAEENLWKDFSDKSSSGRKPKNAKLRKKICRIAAVTVVAAVLISGFCLWRHIQNGNDAYAQAMSLFDSRQYAEASAALDKLEKYTFSEEQTLDIGWYQALCSIQTENYSRAIRELGSLQSWRDSDRYLRQLITLLSGTTGAGEKHSAALRKDGTVVTTGDNSYGQCATSEWRNITSIACGTNHTLGLKSNGTVEAVGADESSQCALGEWHHIIDIAAGEKHSVGVTNNGRVVTAGDNSYGQCDTLDWTGIVAVAAGRNHTVGLRQDGTVVAAGDNQMGALNVSTWQNVIAIAAGNGFTAAVTKDGKVLSTGDNTYGECDTSHIENAAGISAGDFHLLVLGYNGRLTVTGDNDWRQGEVALWKNLISAAGGVHHTIAISQDGTAYATGDNKSGQCEVWNWTDLGLPNGAMKSSVFADINQP